MSSGQAQYELFSFFKEFYEKRLVNLSVKCPLREVRELAQKFLEKHGIVYQLEEVSETSFILPRSLVTSLSAQSKDSLEEDALLLKQVYKELFLSFARVPNLFRVLGVLPTYLEKQYLRVSEVLLGDGPLSAEFRFYVAFIGSAADKCVYLMQLFQEQVRMFGHSNIPEKLRHLATASLKLAHRPWEFDQKDVEVLLSHWQISELFHALVVLSVSHCLASVCLGLGVSCEYDLFDTNYSLTIEDSNLFEFLAEEKLPYLDYDISKHPRPVRPSDFNWKDSGFYLLEKVLPKIAESLRVTIGFSYNSTFESFGEEGVNTAPLRRAVWMYTQRVLGLEYDDYDYREVNEQLSRNTKNYLKTVVCYPKKVTKELLNSIDMDLDFPDIVQMVLLVSESKLESELIYLTHCLSSFI